MEARKQTAASINISEVIDNGKLGRFQIGVLALCGLCLILDGFDVQAIGYAGAVLKQDWHIPNQTWGQVVSAALVGVLVGSLFLSILADKIGRRPILAGSCLFFSLATLATARVNSVEELLAMRFLAGVGLGAIMPNAMAMVSEYSPRRLRAAMMMAVSNGFTIGAIIVGFAAAWLLPVYGWRSLFYLGGVIPLIVGVIMLIALPESLQFLALKGKDPKKIAKWLARIEPAAVKSGSETRYIVNEEKKQGATFLRLFREGRAMGTILIWLIYFLNLLNLYFLAGWLPAVAKAAGHSTTASALLGTMEQVGGIFGALALGWFVHRLGFVSTLTTCFLIASVSVAFIGWPGLSAGVLFAVVFVAGFGIVGGQAGVNSLTGIYYPTELRSTGLGAGLGIGRFGSIAGPIIAGVLLSRHWSDQQLFLAAAVPALLSAGLMISMRWLIKPAAISTKSEAAGD